MGGTPEGDQYRIADTMVEMTLRGAGWRGSGYVRWGEPTNRGFLRALLGLQRAAAAIGEADEDERCMQFLMQLDPSGVPDSE